MLRIFFYIIVKIRCLLYKFNMFKSIKVKAKLISIGNITTGGTGKTPFVISLIKKLNEKKSENFENLENKIAVIEKGYKGSFKGVKEVFLHDNPQVVGDEPLMLKNALKQIPVIISKNKTKAAQFIDKNLKRIELIILDDGFQHLRLYRNLNIVLVNASIDIFKEKLLPLGKLREPISSLRRADILILTKTNFQSNLSNLKIKLSSFVNKEKIFTAKAVLKHKNYLPKKVFLLTAIEDSSFLEKLLKAKRVDVFNKSIYPDHYAFSQKDIEEALSFGLPVLTTSKDFVKIKNLVLQKKSKNLTNKIDHIDLNNFIEVWYEHEVENCSQLISYIKS